MPTNIKQMNTDIKKMRADIKQSNRTFIIQFAGLIGAAVGHYRIK